MIKVYLCDDEPIWLKRIEHAITSYQVSTDWEFSIACIASDPEELLETIRTQLSTNGIYFLDIDYKASLNGLALGQEIRRLDPDAFLIYITTHDEMAMETFHLKLMALDYIIKDSPDFEERVYQCMKHIEEHYFSTQNDSTSLTLHLVGSHRVLLKKDIYFIEAQKGTHKISIHTTYGLLTINYPLTTLQTELGDDFVLCSKSCLVNIAHISAANRDNRELILDNGQVCCCSFRMWKKIIDALYS